MLEITNVIEDCKYPDVPDYTPERLQTLVNDWKQNRSDPAFTLIYKYFWNKLQARWVGSNLSEKYGNSAQAELIQDVLLSVLYVNIDGIDTSQIEAYVNRAFTNRAHNLRRRITGMDAESFDELTSEVFDEIDTLAGPRIDSNLSDTHSPEKKVSSKELEEQLEDFISALPGASKGVFQLRRMGYSYKEIADRADFTPAHARKLYYQARQNVLEHAQAIGALA
jgi:RNA polymerase sigma factor (sigma-70 family)